MVNIFKDATKKSVTCLITFWLRYNIKSNQFQYKNLKQTLVVEIKFFFPKRLEISQNFLIYFIDIFLLICFVVSYLEFLSILIHFFPLKIESFYLNIKKKILINYFFLKDATTISGTCSIKVWLKLDVFSRFTSN